MKWKKMRSGLAALLRFIASKILFVEHPPIPSVAAIIVRKQKILLLWRGDGYILPGGMLMAGETNEKALAREVREETGLAIFALDHLFSTEECILGFIPCISTVYRVEVDGIERDSEEGKLEWRHPREAVGQMVYKTNDQALRRYFKAELADPVSVGHR